jgi:uncharacterized protein YqgV (UPF0045/DUF77 family)
MLVRVDISLYPLATPDLAPVIFEFVRVLEQHGLEVTTGPLSSTLAGESQHVFDALRAAFEAVAAQHRAALVIKVISVGKPGQEGQS